MNLKKILIYAGVALLVFFLVTQPNGAAGIVHNILGSVKGGADALITFTQNVVH